MTEINNLLVKENKTEEKFEDIIDKILKIL